MPNMDTHLFRYLGPRRLGIFPWGSCPPLLSAVFIPPGEALSQCETRPAFEAGLGLLGRRDSQGCVLLAVELKGLDRVHMPR